MRGIFRKNIIRHGGFIRERCIEKKSKKKLTSVSFMYVCVAENVELLVFFTFLLRFAIFQNFPCTLGEKSESVSFSKVYVCVKAKQLVFSFFLLFFLCTFP